MAADRFNWSNGLKKEELTPHKIVKEKMARTEAALLGREGLIEKFRHLYPELQLNSCAFDQSWSLDCEAWVYGEVGSVELKLTGPMINKELTVPRITNKMRHGNKGLKRKAKTC